MKSVLSFVVLLTFLISACAPAGLSADAQATSVSMAVQLTLLAQVTDDSATATQSPTEAPLTALPTDTPQPTFTSTSEPTEEPTDEPTDQPNPTPYVVPDWPLFRNGDEGPEVHAIQYLLRSHGYNLVADGKFGPATRQQVIAFQNTKNLSADGIVGPQTWAALIQGKQINQGKTGDAVRALQVLLHKKFEYNQVDIDGNFGPITNSAVEDFQDTYDLDVDGIVGPETWQALVAIEP